ncbi:MAG: LamG-like jellyroll fold domain-containing protein [Acidobacteriota bacterium]
MAWWALDEDSGATAFDLVAGNNGKLVGGPARVSGVVDHGLSFDRIDDYVQIPDSSLLDIGIGDFSIDAWIQTSSSTGVRVIVDKRSSEPRGYSLFISQGRLSLQLAGGANNYTNYVSNAFVGTGMPYHVAVTVDRDQADGVRFYLNGAEVLPRFDPGAYAGRSLDNTFPLRMGARSFGRSGFWDGLLDEVELFNRALIPSEVAAIFAARSAGKCKCRRPGCTPIAWWPLDESAGTLAPDIAGHASGPHDGAIARPDPVTGRVGGALLFNGQGDLVRVSSGVGLGIDLVKPSAFSIDAWVRTSAVGFQPIVTNTIPYPLNLEPIGYQFFLGDGLPGFIVTAITGIVSTATAGGICTGCANLADGQWHLLGATVIHDAEGSNLEVKLYVDGLLVETFPAQDLKGSAKGGDLLIGALQVPNLFFEGAIDEVEIFDHVLVQADFSGVFAAAGAGKCKTGLPPRNCGLNSPACPQGQYCNYSIETACGTAGNGVCRRITPGHCVLWYVPVCGCDGRTYPTDCEADKAGVSVAAEGACQGTACFSDVECRFGTVCEGCSATDRHCIEGCRFNERGCPDAKECHDAVCKTCPCPDVCLGP